MPDMIGREGNCRLYRKRAGHKTDSDAYSPAAATLNIISEGIENMPKKILIIDDEPDIRDYISAVLEDNGFEASATDGNEAAGRTTGQYRPDLIILDIMMPKRSGLSIYRELRTTPELKPIPVILISGLTRAGDFTEDEFAELIKDDNIPRPDAFIEKPVDIKVLLDTVHQLMG